ncbi:ATP-binding protein [Olsenella sp. Marseille-P4559]|uniref:ATP-binding protein n=1 Tax=Olsenella sp. Marseille-P4559 TaxID=2364795 RepID=UPI002110BE07|nr:ATP-binding protein [Olsenella sp. Marseille-P4559]
MPGAVAGLERAAEKGAPERRLRLCSHLSLLAIDGLGCLEAGKMGADLISRLVSRRYGKRSTMVTTNVGIGAWTDVLGDAAVASAMADRLCHHCHVLRMTGRPHRIKDLLPEGRGGAGSGGGD